MPCTVTAKGLAALFELMLLRHESGLAVLLGTVEPPDTIQLCDMLRGTAPEDLGVRVTGGRDIPEAEAMLMLVEDVQEILREIGSWNRINRSFLSYRQKFPKAWEVFEAHALFIRPGGAVRDGSGGLGRMLQENFGNVSARTLRRWRNNTLLTLANYVLSWQPGDEEFQLRG